MIRTKTRAGTAEKEKVYVSGTAGEKKTLLRAVTPYLMVAPSIALFGIFMIYPIFYMIYISFFKWNMLSDKVFIGLDNYKNMFQSAEFLQVLRNSFQYMGGYVVLTMALSLLLALYLKKNTRINAFLQSVAFAPYIVSLVSVSFIWMWLMDTDFGLLNYILSLFGLPKVGWLEDPQVAMWSLILVSIWKSVGYNAIILVSALQAIPGYLYEAASLDRGKPWTVFAKITLPMLSPTLFFLTLMNIISSFKVFETINIMTKGEPMNSTNTLVYYIYEYGFSYYKIGYASAVGVVLMVIIGALTLLYFKLLDTKVHYR